AYASDLARYARSLRAVTREAYEICDKLTLIQPALDDVLRCIWALTSHQLAEFQVEDGERPDLEHYYRAERLWDEICRKGSPRPADRAGLAFVRDDLADALAARGRVAEAQEYRRRALAPVRGDAWICFEMAVNEAENARSIGQYPLKLDARQQ